MSIGDKETIVEVNIYVRTDSLMSSDTDEIAEQTAKFNSEILLDGKLKFDVCKLYIQNNGNRGHTYYTYKIGDSKYELIHHK